MTEIKRKNLPMVVTLIDLHQRRNSTVLLLEGISPQNYKGKAIYRLKREAGAWQKDKLEDVPGHPELVDRTASESWTHPVERYWLIQGRRFDLVELAHKNIDDYNKACEQRSKDKNNAEREFEDAWGKAHPYPELPDVRKLIEPHLVDHMASA